jgi:hypothetical protein
MKRILYSLTIIGSLVFAVTFSQAETPGTPVLDGGGKKKCKTGDICTHNNYRYCSESSSGDSCICYYCK